MQKENIKATLKEAGIPVTFLCRKIGISQSAFYRWIGGNLNLSAAKEKQIQEYVQKVESAII